MNKRKIRLDLPKVKELLDTKGYNRSAVADKLGLDPSTVCIWLRGESTPLAKNLNALANLLETPISELLESKHTKEK